MHEGYWKVWTRIETVLSWKQHDSLLFPKSSSKTGLQCRSCWKLVGQLWHQKLWLFPVVDRFSQMLASMLKVTQLQFRRKTHTYFLKVPLFGYPATQCYTCQSLCISIQVYPVSPGKGGDKAFMSKLKQNEEKDLWRVFTACPKKLQDRIEKDVDIWYMILICKSRLRRNTAHDSARQEKIKPVDTGGLCFQLSSIREIRAFTQSQQWILLCWHSRQQFIYTSIWVTMRR